MSTHVLLTAVLLLLAAPNSQAAEPQRQVVIFDGNATEAAVRGETSKDLWITAADLTRATKFEIKPEGVCTATLCFPLPEARRNDFLAKQGDVTWFNLSEFARLLKQPVAHDAKHAVWFFGPRTEVQNVFLKTLTAPDFTLPAIDGKMHSLSDFRGKKVLLLTWASW